ncbi:MAG TPA: hypothetical protein VMU07_04085, partial [Candidatus Paceibacterota bacterium]|nr:hypothetical protein [Candidatus Paceibacterota bacterium]
SLLFSVVFEIIVAVTFLTIAIALISRYIYLAFLLIILPLAWLSWVIPKMEHHFVKWWSTFFKWTFFPAISIMFVYLAMLSVTVTNGNVSVKDAQVQPIDSQKGSPLLAVSTAIGGNSNLIQTALDEILMAGLCLGGLFAANELSIKGADTAIHGLTKVKDAAVGYVGKEAKKGARYTYQRVGGQKLNERLQRSRIPGVSRLGTAMQDVTKKGGKDLVKKEAENLHLGDRGDDELERMLQGARPMDRKLAILGEYQKRDKLDKVKSIDGVDLSTWLQRPDSERAFKDYDHGKLQKDIDNSLNSDKTMRAVAKKQGSVMVADTNNYLGKGVNAMVPAVDLSRRASEEARKAQDVGDKLEERKKKGENISDADINLNKQEVSKAEAARKAANAAMDDVTVVDTEGILDEKAKGAEVKAGNLMRAASKKFYAGKDASDIGKSNPGAIFDGKAHYGLDERSLKALSRAVSHGIASEIPSVVSKITGKLDSQSKLEALAAEWHGAIIDAYEYDAEKRGQLLDSFKKVMGNKLLFASSEAPAPVAAAGGGGAAPAAGH